MLFIPPQQDKKYVGFAALPNQLHRKSIKKGFDFTLMVAGLGVLERGPVVGLQETLAVPTPDQLGLSCPQGSQAWGNPPSSTACFSPTSMRIDNCQRPVVRPSPSSPGTLPPPKYPGYTLFLSIWVSHNFLGDSGSLLFSPLKNRSGQLILRKEISLPQTPYSVP